MLRQKQNSRFCALLLTAALLAAVLSGCAPTGTHTPAPAPADNMTAVPEQTSVVSVSPDAFSSDFELPIVSDQPEVSPAEPSAPVVTPEPMVTPEPAPATTPEPAPVTTPEPTPVTTPEPTPVTTPEPAPVSTPEPSVSTDPVPEELVADTTPVAAELEDEAVALSAAPAAVPHPVSAVASGILEKKNANAVIDYSHTEDGYVMVQYTAQTDLRLKVQVKGPTTTYTYNLPPQKWAVFPLSDGNGVYQVTVYQNVTGSKYAAVLSMNTPVELKDEFAPFLHSNQYVDYDNAPKTVAKAEELIGSVTDPLKKVETVYDYVVKGMTYDKQLASTVKSGYLPVLDTVLEKKSGICFDYAALMTGMLRSQGVPCKLVVGYAGTAYHAWISVWVDGSGWVDGVIWFDGTNWQRMDPTFASSGKSSQSILAYIGDGTNYTAKYFY